MNHRLYVTVVAAALCLAGTSAAQGVNAPAPSQAVASDTAVSMTTRMSVIDKPSEAVRRGNDVAPAAPLPATGANLGTAKAQMIVGGAAFVAGALIHNDAGTVLMLGGAVVGLYGLWNYLK
jgi:hypothetical protein